MQNSTEEVSKRMLVYRQQFDDVFQDVVNELVEPYENNPELAEAGKVLRETFLYNTFDGKKSRGLMVVGTLDFIKDGKLTDLELKNALYLGWCVEILQAMFLIADDIMDRSEMRRGKPCWYKKCGLKAINDTYLLEQCIYQLIEKHFSNESYCLKLFKTFHNITFMTAMGQELDLLASDPACTFSLDNFTEDKYCSIVKYKTAYYSFYMPVSIGMMLAGVTDDSVFKMAETVLLKLGEFFQIQDDFLDCFGDPKVMGKVGRDIEDAKCSWLVVQALKHVSSEERKLLDENYGKDNEECVKVVKTLFKKLQLESLYQKYEDESYQSLEKLINASAGTYKTLFIYLVKRIYKRQK